MSAENLPEGMSPEEVHSLMSVQRSYGTYDADYEMIQTDNEDLEEAATRDPKADKSKSREAESKESEKSERAKTKPREEKRKRSSKSREEEPKKTERRPLKRTRDSPPRKPRSEKSSESRTTKKGIHYTEVFLSTHTF